MPSFPFRPFPLPAAIVLLTTASLGGCGLGSPWGRGPDPNAAAAAQDAAPLVAECHHLFAQSLNGMKVNWDSGPTVMRDGALTTVELAARPDDPNVLQMPRYSCSFENGKLDHSEPVL